MWHTVLGVSSDVPSHLLSGAILSSHPGLSSFGQLFGGSSCEYVHLVRRLTVLADGDTGK